MGVHGLWDIVAPIGRTVDVKTLANRRYAVDASIWMVQFVKAMRDAEGVGLPHAHLLGFFRRIVRLLVLNIRPVFVFDGATPGLKRRTVAARRKMKEQQGVKLRRVAEKIVMNELQRRAVDAQLVKSGGGGDAQGVQSGSAASAAIDLASGGGGSGGGGGGSRKRLRPAAGGGVSRTQQAIEGALDAAMSARAATSATTAGGCWTRPT